MRRYLLDTGPLGAYLQGRQPAVDLIVPWIRRGEAATSILVYGELIEYIKSLDPWSFQEAVLSHELAHGVPGSF
jgi:hypothetical protein